MTAPTPQYTYAATVDRVIDGDTVQLDIDCGFSIHVHTIVRLLGINAPEVVGVQKAAGLAARAALAALLPPGAAVLITTQKDKDDKYGRLLAQIYLADGTTASDHMLESGHAAPYDGHGPRPVPVP